MKFRLGPIPFFLKPKGVRALCLLTTSLLLLGACSKPVEPSNGVKFKIPWFQSDGSYQMQEVHVASLKDLSHLQGDAADIRVDADITLSSFSGPLSLFQFLQVGTSGGLPVLVPEDALSLEMASLYAQTEYIRKFDAAAGADGWLSYPRKIALMDKAEVTDGQNPLENNAMYVGSSDATVIVKYSLAQLPISLNAGIMAHEHFHALFQASVLNAVGKTSQGTLHVYDGGFGQVPEPSSKMDQEQDLIPTPAGTPGFQSVPLPDMKQAEAVQEDPDEIDLYNTILIRGINEGFADVWGWLFSGQSKFIYNSLPNELVDRLVTRSMNAPTAAILSTADLNDKVFWAFPKYRNAATKDQALNLLTQYSYKQGAYYARFIYALIKIQNGISTDVEQVPDSVRAKAAINFLQILPALRDELIANGKKKRVSVLFPIAQAMKLIPLTASSGAEKASSAQASCVLFKKTMPLDLSSDERKLGAEICPEKTSTAPEVMKKKGPNLAALEDQKS